MIWTEPLGDINTWKLIVVALACYFFGILIGWINWGSKKKRDVKED